MIKDGYDNVLVHVVFHCPTKPLDIKKFKGYHLANELTHFLNDNPSPREGAMD